MIFEVNGLFINTANISTISAFSKEVVASLHRWVVGISIDGVEYTLYTFDPSEKEKIDETTRKMRNVVATIINSLVTPVQRLNLEEKTND